MEMFFRLLGILVYLLIFPYMLLGFQVKDPIFVKVESAKDTFHKEMDSAKNILIESLKAQIKKSAETGNLELVQKLIMQKREFEVYPDKLPQAEEFRLFVDAYQNKIQDAKADLVKTYKDSVIQYTKKLDIEKAESVKRELDGFLNMGDVNPANNNLPKQKQENKNINKIDGANHKFDFNGLWICNHPRTRWVGKRMVDGETVIDFNGTICSWNQVGLQISVFWPKGAWEKLTIDRNNENKLVGKTSKGMVTTWERVKQ